MLSSSLWESEGENATIHGCLDFIWLGAPWECKGASELPIAPLTDRIPRLVSRLVTGLRLTADGEAVIVNVNVDILLVQTRKVNGSLDLAGPGKLLDIHPWYEGPSDSARCCTLFGSVAEEGTTVVEDLVKLVKWIIEIG